MILTDITAFDWSFKITALDVAEKKTKQFPQHKTKANPSQLFYKVL